MPKIKEENWYGFDHEQVKKLFEGDPEYIRTFEVNGTVRAVYKSATPNRDKGHKDYMMLTKTADGRLYVSGKDEADMEPYRRQSAIHCLACDTVLYSISGHHYHKCGCPNESMVDGGRDYLRSGGVSLELAKPVTLDLLTGEILPYNEKSDEA